MMVIHKYPIRFAGFGRADISVQMPERAEILSVQLQHGILQAWAIVDPNRDLVSRRLVVIGTGIQFSVEGIGVHVATVQVAECVWHVFDRGES